MSLSHRRFGHRKQVYIVWGSPLSGKSTLVRELMQYGDIVLDMDRLWEAITMQPAYTKPNNVRFNVFALRDNLLDQIKTRYGQWYDAYIIGGYPDANERDRLAKTLGAELIYCKQSRNATTGDGKAGNCGVMVHTEVRIIIVYLRVKSKLDLLAADAL